MCKCVHLDLLLLVLSNGLSHYQFKISCCQRELLAELSSLRKMLNIILKKRQSKCAKRKKKYKLNAEDCDR